MVDMEEEEARATVRKALQKRESHIMENYSTLTVKKVRKMLEEDIGMKLDSKFLKSEVLEGLNEIQARMDVAEDGSNQGQESGEQTTSQKSGSPPSKKRKIPVTKNTAKKQAKKQRTTKPNSKASSGEREMDKLRKLIHDAGLRLSPHFYSQHKDMESRRKGMEDYLKEHGLNINSKQNEVRAVKIKLELQRDLEGMDTSNIMDGNGRRPMRASARKSYKTAASDNDDGENEDNSATEKPVCADGVSKNLLDSQKKSPSISKEDQTVDDDSNKGDDVNEDDDDDGSGSGCRKDTIEQNDENSSSSAQEDPSSEEDLSNGSEDFGGEVSSDSDYHGESSASG